MSAFGTSGHWRVDFAVLHKTAALQKRGLGGRSMRRREFTTLLAGAAVLVDYSEMDPFTDSPIRPTRQYAAWRRKAPLPTLGAEGSPKSTGYARLHGPRPIPDGKAITVPTGYSEFPREILRPPRSLAERLHRHSPLELHAARRPFCRNGAARAFGARVARVLPAAARVRWLELARGRWCDRKAAHIVACDQIGDQPG